MFKFNSLLLKNCFGILNKSIYEIFNKLGLWHLQLKLHTRAIVIMFFFFVDKKESVFTFLEDAQDGHLKCQILTSGFLYGL